jgi:hypothetical protein
MVEEEFEDVNLYSYAEDFITSYFKKTEDKLERSFNFTFRYADHVLSLNNFKLRDYIDRIYPILS